MNAIPAGASTRRILWPALTAAIAVAVLIALGFWQLQRLQWKQEHIHLNTERFAAAPLSLPSADAWPGMDDAAVHARRTRVSGMLHHDRHVRWFTAAPGGGGAYHRLTPLQLSGGGWVIVDRGPDDSAAGVEQATVSGLIRRAEIRRWFHPADDSENGLWFVRDPLAIAAALGLSPAAPVFIEEGGEPVERANNHLGYAITWFSLAAVLLAICATLHFSGRRRP